MIRPLLPLFLAVSCLFSATDRPNVVIIYADDLGYGDVGCYGATKIQTPNIDKLAEEGRMFTDAHTVSATCTPSRYGVLTGQYAWRVGNWGPVFSQSALVIDPDRKTIADVFKEAGYNTAVIGKWHLGFGEEKMSQDWNGDLKPGPLEVGFDYYYGVPVVNSHPPFVYVENHRVVGLTEEDPLVWKFNTPNPHAEKVPAEIGGKATERRKSQNGFRGGKEAHMLYRDAQVGTHLTEKALEWMRANKDEPFFLYYGTTAIHHPFTPHPRFLGTSEAGVYGDFVHELDWITGEIMNELEALGLAENTVVIFTSDNGGMPNRAGRKSWELGHRMNGDWLGVKFDIWEGGHRIPFVVRWPGKVPAGTESNALISSVDLTRSFADYLNVELPENAAEDSLNILSELSAAEPVGVRNTFMMAAQRAEHLAIRHNNWVYIPAKGGGGFGNGMAGMKMTGYTNSDVTPDAKIRKNAPPHQLYNLADDPRQQVNIVLEHPDKVAELRAMMLEIAGPNTPATEKF